MFKRGFSPLLLFPNACLLFTLLAVRAFVCSSARLSRVVLSSRVWFCRLALFFSHIRACAYISFLCARAVLFVFLLMCYFPLPNLQFDSLVYRKGVREFDCGACPECLQKRSSGIVLRDIYEAKAHSHSCMITLTYDNFAYDNDGHIVGELPVDPEKHVCKRHIQLFIKRLRKWWSTVSNEPIKYRVCAEYGSRTHRAHYHAILFGVRFPDLAYYKKSKRGNRIYRSAILTRLWSHGICTVDSIELSSPAVSRYCTKYVAKSRSEDTFMLCSQRIGLDMLLRDFNGRSYCIDGRLYPIPRIVWEEYITRKYGSLYRYFSPKYINRPREDFADLTLFERGKLMRRFYREIRDADAVYRSYLSYWHFLGECFNQNKPSVLQRINSLPDDKYHNYKIAAREVLAVRATGVPRLAPGSNCRSAYFRYMEEHGVSLARDLPCPNRASDTENKGFFVFRKHLLLRRSDTPPKFPFLQLNLFDN